jgi:hypothetical protein
MIIKRDRNPGQRKSIGHLLSWLIMIAGWIMEGD